ncbi:MAG: glycosyltransferase [Chitinophagales bacterium]
MVILIALNLLLLIAYGLVIDFYRRSWNQIPYFHISDHEATQLSRRVSVIIPARNEEASISNCLQSLLAQTYPTSLFEILVVNDHSEDRTEEIVRGFHQANIKLLNLGDYIPSEPINSYKKKAIETAVLAAEGDWILCTDADCILPPDWIRSMVLFANRNQCVFIAAPVTMPSNRTLLSVFQSLDFSCLQGITGAVVYKKIHCMCNGANLGYDKKIFGEIGGFGGIDEKASGDDMLLMQKFFSKYPDRVFFIKSESVVVSTESEKTWSSFFRQRIRWASKARGYQDRAIFWNLLFVFTLNAALIVFFISCFWSPRFFVVLLLLIMLKTMVEFAFVRRITLFFGQSMLMKYFFFLQPIHIFYTVIAGLLGNLTVYKWKGRKVK